MNVTSAGTLGPSPIGIDVVVVLVTHNRPELLSEALEALSLQTCPPRDVVVVDNASEAATGLVLNAAPLAIDVVRSETNLGGAGGFAFGMRRALELGSEWIWLMDDDAIAHQDALAELKTRLGTLPDGVGVVCSCVMEFDRIALQHRRRFNAMLGFERPLPASAYRHAAVRVDTASFVGFMVSARAVRAVGLPNAEFFLAYDDTEYSLRLGRNDFGIWMAPASVIQHKRLAASRLRSTEFGAKHYFNIRNRIFVKRSYCSASFVGAALGAAFGLLLWLRAPRRFDGGAWRLLAGAVTDGFRGKLGPFPERLRRANIQ